MGKPEGKRKHEKSENQKQPGTAGAQRTKEGEGVRRLSCSAKAVGGEGRSSLRV